MTTDVSEHRLGVMRDEATRARAFYDDLEKHIEKLQTRMKANELLVVKVEGVRIWSIGTAGQSIFFDGTDALEDDVRIVQHYSRVSMFLHKRRLKKGEKPRRIGFIEKA